MKKTNLLIAAVIIATIHLSAEEPALLISEDFSGTEWAAELLRVDPTYVKPAPGANKAVINTVLYFDKYMMEGAIVPLDVNTDNPTLECSLFASQSIVHRDVDGHAISFRLRNSGVSIMEFPELPNAGIITIHTRNGNKTAGTTLKLQQYITDTWTDIKTFDLQPSGNYRQTSIDEILTYDIQSKDPIKLRISRGDKFIYLFRIDVAAYVPNRVNNPVYAGFKLNDRTLTTDKPTYVEIFNTLGKTVFEAYVEQNVTLPSTIHEGLYIVKGNNGSQKIFINK